MTQYAKTPNVQNVQICTIWQNRRKWPKCEKTPFWGGSKIDIFRCAKSAISDAAARGNPAELCIV
jgi:hypothetical protein